MNFFRDFTCLSWIWLPFTNSILISFLSWLNTNVWGLNAYICVPMLSLYYIKLWMVIRYIYFFSVLPRPQFCDILAKKSQCCIQNPLGAPFVANMQWSPLISRITTKRCQTVCLWLVVFSFCLRPLHNLFIKKWPLHILNHVSHYYLLMSSRINHYWFFRHIFPPKKRTWFERLRFLLQSFLKIKGFWYNNGYFAKTGDKSSLYCCFANLKLIKSN